MFYQYELQPAYTNSNYLMLFLKLLKNQKRCERFCQNIETLFLLYNLSVLATIPAIFVKQSAMKHHH